MSSSSNSNRIVLPEGWPRPPGYANGVITHGPLLHIAGQIGWEPTTGAFLRKDLLGQFGKTLDNVLAVVRAAGGTPQSVIRLTVYVTDMAEYRRSGKALAEVWRARFGRHYPAMALLGVVELVEPLALVEIEALACLSEGES